MTVDIIRRARTADLKQVCDIWYEAEVGDDPDPPPRRAIPSIFQHELDTGEMHVMERDGRILGFAALITRSSLAYLGEFFVRKDCQSSNIGKTLLQHILPKDGRICCTLSSRDPRALALYIRAGMRPQWSNFLLRANTSDIDDLHISEVEVIEGKPNDPAFVHWDAEISGRHRPLDHNYWIEQRHAVPVWFQRQGRIAGYGYIQMCSDGPLWYPDAITLGPIGTRKADDSLDSVCSAVRWARKHAAVVRIAVPGPHPALAPLLNAHFRITYVETFLSSVTEAFANMQCYIPSGSSLF